MVVSSLALASHQETGGGGGGGGGGGAGGSNYRMLGDWAITIYFGISG